MCCALISRHRTTIFLANSLALSRSGLSDISITSESSIAYSRPFSSDLESLKKRYVERLPIYEAVCDKVIDNNNDLDYTIKQIRGE